MEEKQKNKPKKQSKWAKWKCALHIDVLCVQKAENILGPLFCSKYHTLKRSHLPDWIPTASTHTHMPWRPVKRSLHTTHTYVKPIAPSLCRPIHKCHRQSVQRDKSCLFIFMFPLNRLNKLDLTRCNCQSRVSHLTLRYVNSVSKKTTTYKELQRGIDQWLYFQRELGLSKKASL